MEIFRTEEFISIENPSPGTNFRREIVAADQKAKDIGGISVIIPAGNQVPYHYHARRESVIIVISGQATQVVEGQEFPIKAGDVLYVPAGEKHMTVNRSDKDLYTLEFFTCPPVMSDFVEVK